MSDQVQQGHEQELDEVRDLCLYLRTIGEQIRLQIVRRLAQNGEMSVTQLAHTLRVSQPLVSWHLRVLRHAHLVSIRREGRLAWYSLDRPAFDLLCKRLAAWAGEADSPKEGKVG